MIFELLLLCRSSDHLLVCRRALSTVLRFFLLLVFLALAAFCLIAASALDAGDGPPLLARYWPDYYRADYFRRMAEREPRREELWLKRLLAIEPRDSEARVRLATIAEWRGDPRQARALLQQASQDDARYRTQWARFEFEARHPTLAGGDEWITARRCFAMSYGDRRTLLEAVWQLRPDGSFLLDRVIPDTPAVLFHTTSFLMQQGDLPSARRAFARLLALRYGSEGRANAGVVATPVERAHLGLDLTDLHLDRHDPASAVQIWNTLAAHRLTQVDGARDAGRQVVNACFRTEPLGRGFDWRVTPSSGVEMRRVPDGWRVDFAARPADRITLLQQRVLVALDALPRIEILATGANWLQATLVDEATGRKIEKSAKAPPNQSVVLLKIEYVRPAGQPTLREPLLIRQVRWRTAQ